MIRCSATRVELQMPLVELVILAEARLDKVFEVEAMKRAGRVSAVRDR